MQELIQIRIDELSRLRRDLIEKQKKDLAKIEVRISELQGLTGGASSLSAETLETDLPFDEDDQMVLEDPVLAEAEPIVSPIPEPVHEPDLSIDDDLFADLEPIVLPISEPEPTPEPELPPEPVTPKSVTIPPILQNVVVSPEPASKPVVSSPAVGQDDIEALINGLV